MMIAAIVLNITTTVMVGANSIIRILIIIIVGGLPFWP